MYLLRFEDQKPGYPSRHTRDHAASISSKSPGAMPGRRRAPGWFWNFQQGNYNQYRFRSQ